MCFSITDTSNAANKQTKEDGKNAPAWFHERNHIYVLLQYCKYNLKYCCKNEDGIEKETEEVRQCHSFLELKKLSFFEIQRFRNIVKLNDFRFTKHNHF